MNHRKRKRIISQSDAGSQSGGSDGESKKDGGDDEATPTAEGLFGEAGDISSEDDDDDDNAKKKDAEKQASDDERRSRSRSRDREEDEEEAKERDPPPEEVLLQITKINLISRNSKQSSNNPQIIPRIFKENYLENTLKAFQKKPKWKSISS